MWMLCFLVWRVRKKEQKNTYVRIKHFQTLTTYPPHWLYVHSMPCLTEGVMDVLNYACILLASPYVSSQLWTSACMLEMCTCHLVANWLLDSIFAALKQQLRDEKYYFLYYIHIFNREI